MNDVMLVAPVDGLDQLVDVAACLLGGHAVGQLLQQLQHVLERKQGKKTKKQHNLTNRKGS